MTTTMIPSLFLLLVSGGSPAAGSGCLRCSGVVAAAIWQSVKATDSQRDPGRLIKRQMWWEELSYRYFLMCRAVCASVDGGGPVSLPKPECVAGKGPSVKSRALQFSCCGRWLNGRFTKTFVTSPLVVRSAYCSSRFRFGPAISENWTFY